MVTFNKYVKRGRWKEEERQETERERHTESGEGRREIGIKTQNEKPEKGGEAMKRKKGRKEKLSHKHNYIAPPLLQKYLLSSC